MLLHSGIVLHGAILSCAFRPLSTAPPNQIYKPSNSTQFKQNGYHTRTDNYETSQDKEGELLSGAENKGVLDHSDVKVVEQTPCCIGVYRKIFFGFFDCALWKESSFVLFTLGTFCLCFGSMTFPQHQVNFAMHLGAKRHTAAFAPTVVGIFSLASRFIFR